MRHPLHVHRFRVGPAPLRAPARYLNWTWQPWYFSGVPARARDLRAARLRVDGLRLWRRSSCSSPRACSWAGGCRGSGCRVERRRGGPPWTSPRHTSSCGSRCSGSPVSATACGLWERGGVGRWRPRAGPSSARGEPYSRATSLSTARRTISSWWIAAILCSPPGGWSPPTRS